MTTQEIPLAVGALVFYRARVRVLHGERSVSDFLAASGLGLDGVGVEDVLTIDYKPGELVDIARVERAMDGMVAASEREATSFKILSYKVLSLQLVTRDGQEGA